MRERARIVFRIVVPRVSDFLLKRASGRVGADKSDRRCRLVSRLTVESARIGVIDITPYGNILARSTARGAGRDDFQRDGVAATEAAEHFLKHGIARRRVTADSTKIDGLEESAAFDRVRERRVILTKAVLVVAGKEIIKNISGADPPICRGSGAGIDKVVLKICGDRVFHAVVRHGRPVGKRHSRREARLLCPTSVGEHVRHGPNPAGVANALGVVNAVGAHDAVLGRSVSEIVVPRPHDGVHAVADGVVVVCAVCMRIGDRTIAARRRRVGKTGLRKFLGGRDAVDHVRSRGLTGLGVGRRNLIDNNERVAKGNLRVLGPDEHVAGILDVRVIIDERAVKGHVAAKNGKRVGVDRFDRKRVRPATDDGQLAVVLGVDVHVDGSRLKVENVTVGTGSQNNEIVALGLSRLIDSRLKRVGRQLGNLDHVDLREILGERKIRVRFADILILRVANRIDRQELTLFKRFQSKFAGGQVMATTLRATVPLVVFTSANDLIFTVVFAVVRLAVESIE